MSAARKLDSKLDELEAKTDLEKPGKWNTVDYDVLDQELARKAQNRFQTSLEQTFDKNSQSFVHLVLDNIKDSNYKKGKMAIAAFINSKKQYPDFEVRTQAIVNFCHDLIDSIESKRNFPNMHLLSMTKQKEIIDHVVSHFNELKDSLRSLEKAGRDENVVDLRSTHILIRTIVGAVITVFACWAAVTFKSDLGEPFWSVLGEGSHLILDSLFSLFGM